MDRFQLILIRLKGDLKQYELAQLLGVPPTIICDLERGRRSITPEIEKRITEAINEASRKTSPRKPVSAQSNPNPRGMRSRES